MSWLSGVREELALSLELSPLGPQITHSFLTFWGFWDS